MNYGNTEIRNSSQIYRKTKNFHNAVNMKFSVQTNLSISTLWSIFAKYEDEKSITSEFAALAVSTTYRKSYKRESCGFRELSSSHAQSFQLPHPIS